MLSINSPCFLLIPNEDNKRLLLPGKVLKLSGSEAVAEFEEAVPLEPGSEATVFAEWRGKFHQQAITITAAPAHEENTPDDSIYGDTDVQPTMVAFARVGQPVSAESRGSYRVSIAACELYGRVGNQSRCHIVDVSPEGCAIICAKPLTVGQTVNVSFTFDTVNVSGTMKVQTVKELRSGRLRFGLFCVEPKSATRRSLEMASMAAQRQQLQRLAGAA